MKLHASNTSELMGIGIVGDEPASEIPKKTPVLGEDLLKLIRLMGLSAHLNLYFGAVNVCLYMLLPIKSEPVMISGVLSILMFWLVKMKIRYINHSKSWIEIAVTASCGLYLPLFLLIVTLVNFLDAMLAGG